MNIFISFCAAVCAMLWTLFMSMEALVHHDSPFDGVIILICLLGGLTEMFYIAYTYDRT